MRTQLVHPLSLRLLKRGIIENFVANWRDGLWPLNFNNGLRHGVRGGKLPATFKRNANGLNALRPILVGVFFGSPNRLRLGRVEVEREV